MSVTQFYKVIAYFTHLLKVVIIKVQTAQILFNECKELNENLILLPNCMFTSKKFLRLNATFLINFIFMKKLIRSISVFSLLLLLISCANVPQAEVDAAKLSIEAAKKAGADRYAPASFQTAVNAMRSGLVQVEGQNARFALFRNYEAAKTTLTSVTPLSNKALEETVARKETLKAEVIAAIAELTATVASDKVLLAKAPMGKEGRLAVIAISQEIVVVETVLNEVSAGLTNKDNILTLSDKVKPAVEKAKSINTELTEVIAKAKKIRH